MITDAELEDKIRFIIHQLTAIPPEELKLDDDLRADINLDSVSSLELLGMMDEEFGVVIDVESVRDVRTIRDVCDLARRELDVA